MSEFIIYLLTIFFSFSLVWFFVYRPFIKIQNMLTINIVSEIIPDIQSSHNLITTLAASAIMLSFTILKVFENETFERISYIEDSWIMFGMSVLLGVLSGIAIYVLKAHSSALIKAFKDNEGGKDVSTDLIRSLLEAKIRLQRYLLILLLAQAAFFVSAMAFLIGFARVNVK